MARAGNINELELRLVDDDRGTFRVDGFVDGKRLPVREDDEMDVPFGLLPSIEAPGDYFMVTCECGDPGCSGYFDPVVVTEEGQLLHWTCKDLGWDFTFERGAYKDEIRRLINEGRGRLRERSTRLARTGEYHQNLQLFASESYEKSLPYYWKHDQKNRTEERLRKYLYENDPEEFRRRYRRSPLKTVSGCLIFIALLPVLVPIWIAMYLWFFTARALDAKDDRVPRR